jgi:hypothetical protein
MQFRLYACIGQHHASRGFVGQDLITDAHFIERCFFVGGICDQLRRMTNREVSILNFPYKQGII